MSDTTPDTPPPPPPPAASTDEQPNLDKLLGKVRSEGKVTGQKELLGELGFDSSDAAKAAIEDYRARVDAEKSDAERAREEAEQAKAEAASARAAQVESDLRLNVDRALVAAGVKAERMGHAARLVDVEPGAAEDDIATAVTALVGDFPELLAAPEGGPPSSKDWTAKGGTGERKPPSSKSALDSGAELYRSKHRT